MALLENILAAQVLGPGSEQAQKTSAENAKIIFGRLTTFQLFNSFQLMVEASNKMSDAISSVPGKTNSRDLDGVLVDIVTHAAAVSKYAQKLAASNRVIGTSEEK